MVSVICVCDRLDPLSLRIQLRPTRHLDVASHHEARECVCKILISAHALYVGEQRRDRNTFREGIEWTVDAPLRENTAFNDFAVDAQRPGITPFGQGGSSLYRTAYTLGAGSHPVMVHTEPGSSLTGETVQNELSDPLFPESIDNPTENI